MRTRSLHPLFALVVALCLYGCSSQLGTPIDPLPPGNAGTEFRLGEGVVAMSRGPGYKSSPAWSPNGERLGYIVDGYVLDESSEGRDERIWTARDFDAQKIMWSGNTSVLATAIPSGEDSNSGTGTIYRSLAPEGSVAVSEVVSGVTSSSRIDDGSYLVALETEDEEAENASSTRLAVVQNGRVVRTYQQRIRGEITGMSNPNSSGSVALAVRLPRGETNYELRTFDLSDGTSGTAYTLDEGSEVFGSPQWSQNGIYYVARSASDGSSSTSGRLYLVYASGRSEAAPGVGRDFTASSISLSPSGGRLAIVGRLRPNAQTNLHLLDLETDEAMSLTSSDDMEIKNGTNDLAWSPDGEEIAFVARGSDSGTRIYPGPASALLEEFYNVYRMPTS